MNRFILLFCVLFTVFFSRGQTKLSGIVVDEEEKPLSFVNIYAKELSRGTTTNIRGEFELTLDNNTSIKLVFSAIGFKSKEIIVQLDSMDGKLSVQLIYQPQALDEMVITGTMKEVSKLESPIPVEVYSDDFFKSNPAPTIFESIQQVNGVRPQLNCNVCNTGDIHINGLEGPYTSVLIDGMPIVSGLSSVYGLSGIPQSLIERVEIIKGPSSTLYGSEAVGGVINIITKNTIGAPSFSIDASTTSWLENNIDIGVI